MRAAKMTERPSFQLMVQTDVQSIYHMQMPRWLFSDPRYCEMSLDAKVTYTFLLNRFQLSRRNGWVNERGEVFVIFPRKALAKELRICEQRVTAAFKKLVELELVWEKRCGRGDANQIYLAYLSGVSDINPMTDIQPVFAMDGNISYFVVVNKDAPYDTLDEMIAYGKEHPGELTLGAGAPGSTMTILTSQFIKSTGLDCSLVATNGSDADAVAMVMGGNMSCYLTKQTTTQNYLEAGEVKVLASVLPISDKSVDSIKAIPTLADLGYENCTMGTTFIVWAPLGAADGVYEKINELFNAALATESVQTSLAERGCDYVSYGNLEETVARLQSDYASAESAWNDYMSSQG